MGSADSLRNCTRLELTYYYFFFFCLRSFKGTFRARLGSILTAARVVIGHTTEVGCQAQRVEVCSRRHF